MNNLGLSKSTKLRDYCLNLNPNLKIKSIVSWFDSKLNYAISKANSNFKNYRISDVLILIYKLFWDDFCSFYLEIIKPFNSKNIDSLTYSKTIYFFEQLLKLIHPFMPFISEEIWSTLTKRNSNN